MRSESSASQLLAPHTPILVFGDDWGRHVSTMQHLFRHIARDYPVVWVNAIGHRAPSLNRKDLRRALEKVRSVVRSSRPAEGAHEASDQPVHALKSLIIPRVIPWHGVALFEAINARTLGGSIRRELARLGLERPLVVTGTPPSVSMLGTFGERGAVYLCMDDFLHLPGVSAGMLGPLEQRLLARVDATVATAARLVELKRPASGHSYYLPQGVNFAHFAAPRPVPADLAAFPRPIIGFAGGIVNTVDQELIVELATANPSASVVLIGPVNIDVARMHARNIHLLGPRPYDVLPAYVQAFDVGIIPYVLNQHTLSVDPLKLLEYLAAGIPVVTTALPEVEKYRHLVQVATGPTEFREGVRVALDSPVAARERGRDAAREHDWARRAQELLRILGTVANDR